MHFVRVLSTWRRFGIGPKRRGSGKHLRNQFAGTARKVVNMRQVTFGEMRFVGGGEEEVVAVLEEIVVVGERWTAGDEFVSQLENIDWRGMLNEVATGFQLAISDCANGAEVGALFGAGAGAVFAGIGVGPGALAGGAAGCLTNTAIGIVNTATKK
jgi:hypothetical protein